MLSDSDSDVEVVPLAERIGALGERWKGKLTASKLGKRSESERVLTPKEPPTCRNELKKVHCSPVDGGTKSEETAMASGHTDSKELTPGQRAGLAAIRRLEASTSERSKENRIPVFDLTDDDIESAPPPAKRPACTSNEQTELSRPSPITFDAPPSPVLDLSMEYPDSPPTSSEDTGSCTIVASSAVVPSNSGGPTSQNSVSSCSGKSGSSRECIPGTASTVSQTPGTSLGISATAKESVGQAAPSVTKDSLGRPEFTLKPGKFVVQCMYVHVLSTGVQHLNCVTLTVEMSNPARYTIVFLGEGLGVMQTKGPRSAHKHVLSYFSVMQVSLT